MKKLFTSILTLTMLCFCFCLKAQITIKGDVKSAKDGALYDVGVIIKGTTEGISTDFDGHFELRTARKLPITLEVKYVGYKTQEIIVSDTRRLEILLEEDTKLLTEVVVTGNVIDTKKKESPLNLVGIDSRAIAAVPSENAYKSLSSLKDVDAISASIGNTTINTRGFNSTSPVRSLQIIDGVDNQSPGLNFSLGNFLGSSDLDLNKIDLVIGAASAYYGPNAFNGVISMETKNPFYSKGFGVSVKTGERRLLETAIRYADAFKNKKGQEFMAYKINGSFLRADDWEANNYEAVTGSTSAETNPAGYDRINVYGDEYDASNDFGKPNGIKYPGLGVFHRRGYKEEDLVDYNTRNFKGNLSLHFRTKPTEKDTSPELIFSSSYSNGTTVYQGDNRFSLKNIQFFQNRLEYRLKDKFFIRAYATNENAGDSYDPYFTALLMQRTNKTTGGWQGDYVKYWRDNYEPQIYAGGYPKLITTYNEQTGAFTSSFDQVAADKWLKDNNEKLVNWHSISANFADTSRMTQNQGLGGLLPGTKEFNDKFKQITGNVSSKRDLENPGTRFFDLSALYHIHGEYKKKLKSANAFIDEYTIGANGRMFRPNTRGSIFYDTAGTRITVSEFGVYGGVQKRFWNNKMIANATLRLDKNQNFPLLASPAASLIYKPNAKDFVRLTFSSAIRNPTLSDQYLYLNVGRAILAGNLNGFNNLYPVKDFVDFLDNKDLAKLEASKFNIAAIVPEKVKTAEIGYRTTLGEKVYVDMGYYFSFYKDFLGYKIGIESDFDPLIKLPQNTTVYRVAANSQNVVTTQGFSIGTSYFFKKNYAVNANYSWNKLNKQFKDDPIIPAFNTPEHKYNIGFSGSEIKVTDNTVMGFNFNYKWIKGFTYEGSPQFTGAIPSYDMVDGQINFGFKKIDSSIKIGGSNLLNNKVFQVYGGPRIGRLVYVAFIYDMKKKSN